VIRDVAESERKKAPTMSEKDTNTLNEVKSVLEHPQSAAFCHKNKHEKSVGPDLSGRHITARGKALGEAGAIV